MTTTGVFTSTFSPLRKLVAFQLNLPTSYTCVLHSSKDGEWYSGVTSDPRARVNEHPREKVPSTRSRPVAVRNRALMPVSSMPNLPGPCGPEPGSATSKVLARKYTSPKRFVQAVPQISRYLEVGKGSTYAVIWSLLTCSPANVPVGS